MSRFVAGKKDATLGVHDQESFRDVPQECFEQGFCLRESMRTHTLAPSIFLESFLLIHRLGVY